LVSFSAVAKRYPGGQEALKDVSFALEPGELAFLTGRSGAGKSTLLKLIAASERPSAGSVVVNGQNVGALKRAAIPYLRVLRAPAEGSGAPRARRARQGEPAGPRKG
jgi:cell division transport system ATP-binding protein